MRMKSLSHALVAVAAISLTTPTFADDTVKLSQHRASNLVGATIKNAANESVGEVQDLILDHSGRVAYVVVSHGGFIGIGEKLTAVPWDALHFGREEGILGPYKSVTLPVTKEQMQNAPTFAEDNYPRVDDNAWVLRVYRVYNLPVRDNTHDADENPGKAKKAGKKANAANRTDSPDRVTPSDKPNRKADNDGNRSDAERRNRDPNARNARDANADNNKAADADK